jgi:hypothetical protein
VKRASKVLTIVAALPLGVALVNEVASEPWVIASVFAALIYGVGLVTIEASDWVGGDI